MAFSADAPFSIAGPPAARASGRLDLQEHPERAVPCTLRAARRAAALAALDPDSASDPAWARGPASDSGPAARVVLQASSRLQAKRRALSVPPADMHAVAASNIRSPKKAR